MPPWIKRRLPSHMLTPFRPTHPQLDLELKHDPAQNLTWEISPEDENQVSAAEDRGAEAEVGITHGCELINPDAATDSSDSEFAAVEDNDEDEGRVDPETLERNLVDLHNDAELMERSAMLHDLREAEGIARLNFLHKRYAYQADKTDDELAREGLVIDYSKKYDDPDARYDFIETDDFEREHEAVTCDWSGVIRGVTYRVYGKRIMKKQMRVTSKAGAGSASAGEQVPGVASWVIVLDRELVKEVLVEAGMMGKGKGKATD